MSANMKSGLVWYDGPEVHYSLMYSTMIRPRTLNVHCCCCRSGRLGEEQPSDFSQSALSPMPLH